MFSSRPPFNRKKHNPTNPILGFVREYTAERFLSQGVAAAAVLHSWNDLLIVDDATADQAVHARRVLTRLANLTKESVR